MSKFQYKLAPITAFQMIQEVIDECRDEKSLITVIGSSGHGKSIGINGYLKRDSNCLYLEIKPGQLAKSFFLTSRDQLLDLKSKKTNPSNSYTSIHWSIETLSYEIIDQKPTIIIIDEAGNFKQSGQSLLRHLWDNVKGTCGMALFGPDKYKHDLVQWNRDLSSGIPEWVSRMDNMIDIPVPSEDDIELICKSNDIIDKKIIKFIFKENIDLRGVHRMVLRYHAGKPLK